MLSEGEAWRQSFQQARACNFGDKPLIALTGARDADPHWRAIWVNGMQTEPARLSTRGKQIILENSGHAIPLTMQEAETTRRLSMRRCAASCSGSRSRSKRLCGE